MKTNRVVFFVMVWVLLGLSGTVCRATETASKTASKTVTDTASETASKTVTETATEPASKTATDTASKTATAPATDPATKAPTYTLHFRINSPAFDPSYMDNAATLDRMLADLKSATAKAIYINATASPDGRMSMNEQLSQARKETIVELLREHMQLERVGFHANSAVEDWDMVLEMVKADPEVPEKEAVINEIVNTSREGTKLQTQLQQHTRAYEYLKTVIFPRLRSCEIIVINQTRIAIVDASFPAHLPQNPGTLARKAPEAPAEAQTTKPAETKPSRLTLKTNTLGLALGHANLALEIDLAPHWSLNLPFYYSGGFDYFKPTIKFRGIVLQPEARYYIKDNSGFYLGAHLGLGWYNFALDGEFRIQDHKGRRPAYGGGVGLGYALQFKKAPSWGLEFALGAGVYDVKYDIFYNEANGPYAEHGVHNTFVGIDNASIAITYTFNKKGGRR